MAKRGADYDAYKEGQAAISRQRSAAGRDIGGVPDIANVRRRARCRKSLRLFAETYTPEAVSKGWSSNHLKAIARIEEAILLKALYALAMERGAGKTTLCRVAALWALSYAHVRYPFVIGATDEKARETLDTLRVLIRFLPEYAADFPEISWPAACLGGIANRASGQTCGGESTLIDWSADRIVLPTVPPPDNWPKAWPLRADGKVPTAGCLVSASGLTGEGIRGSLKTLATGEMVRPDLVLIDDPQTSEALDVDTPIPTPVGFVRMGDLSVGDVVFDEGGTPCTVTATSPAMVGRPCYRVVFDDGTWVVADGGHLWTTSTALQRTNARRQVLCPNPSFASRPQCRPGRTTVTVTTAHIAATLTGEGGRNNHSIPMAGSLDTPAVELPIPPYTFGVWLGDGDTQCGRVTTADPEILGHLTADGFAPGTGTVKRLPGGRESAAKTYTAGGLTRRLRQFGFLGNKHVPAAYLFASRPQRLSLLQGLMDTDGMVASGTKGVKGPRCGFANTNLRLIEAVLHLCRSLGIKATRTRSRDDRPGSAPCWSVNFITTEPVFRLTRKLCRLPAETRPDTRRRYVVAVEPVPTRPVRCIAVSSASRMYLCGPGLVPTHNSAGSPTQNTKRLKLITADVLGMAGPGEGITGVMPCTVIQPGDMIDEVLDRKKHPLWRGERTGILASMPANLEAWDRHFDVYAQCAQQEPPDFAEANADYVAHRAELDAGAEASWAERKQAGEVSAVQSAMYLYFRDKRAFWAEYMNRPVAENPAAANALSGEELLAKEAGPPAGVVPRSCTRVVAFVDVGLDLLWWAAGAFDERYGGGVASYGVYPEQGRAYFSKADPRPGLCDPTKGQSEDAAIYAGLAAVVGKLAGTTFRQEETGHEMRVERILVDAKWGEKTDLVFDFCRRSPHAALLLPAQGRGIGATANPMSSWAARPGERAGRGWRLSASGGGRHVTVDTNMWKSFAADRLRTPAGAAGCWRLPAPGPVGHALLVDHLTAEYPVAAEAKTTGRTVDEWKRLPNRDNDWWDCVVGLGVAASVQGLVWSAGGEPPAPRPAARPTRLSDVQKRRQRERAR